MKELETVFYCILVSVLWGATNPLIKKSTKDIVKIKSSNPIYRFLRELWYLLKNPWYLFFFFINQGGSLLFFILLRNENMSVVVPTVNTLTFLITGIIGIFMEESRLNLKKTLGIIFILIGTTFCIYNNYLVKNQRS